MHVRTAVLTVSLLTLLAGCSPREYRPGSIINSGEYSGLMTSKSVLVPRVPFETRQNEIFQSKQLDGTDYAILIGPYPWNSLIPAKVESMNSSLSVRSYTGFSVLIGKQPHIIRGPAKISSSGTHFIAWEDAGMIYVFAEETRDGYPINIEPIPPAPFKAASITTGQYAKLDVAGVGPVVIDKYFDPMNPGVLNLPPNLLDFVTYVRVRTIASGLVPETYYGMNPPKWSNDTVEAVPQGEGVDVPIRRIDGDVPR